MKKILLLFFTFFPAVVFADESQMETTVNNRLSGNQFTSVTLDYLNPGGIREEFGFSRDNDKYLTVGKRLQHSLFGKNTIASVGFRFANATPDLSILSIDNAFYGETVFGIGPILYLRSTSASGGTVFSLECDEVRRKADNKVGIINTETETTITNGDAGIRTVILSIPAFKISAGAYVLSNYREDDNPNLSSTEELVDSFVYTNGTGVVIPSIPGPIASSFGPGGSGIITWVYRRETVYSILRKTEITNYDFPVTIEIPFCCKKFNIRIGALYEVFMKRITEKRARKSVLATTTLITQPYGGVPTTEVETAISYGPEYPEETLETNTWSRRYTVGFQWNIMEDLTLSANALLDSNFNSMWDNTPGADARPNIMEEDTYPNINLSWKFRT